MQQINYQVDNRIAYITLNRPEKRNAFNRELVSELKEAFSQAEKDEMVKVIILKAEGKVFCAGADLGYLQSLQTHTFEENLAIKNLKIAYGTRNFLHEPAMLTDELFSAFNKADTLVNEIFSSGSNCIAFGEMGIGNTSAAAIIMNKITGIAIEECAGKGTGLSNEGLVHKIMILKKAMLKHQTKSVESILQTFGGFEIAMIYQSILKAAENKMLIIIDGFIVTAALLAAHVTNPSIINFCVFAHQSDENGHKAMLKFLNVEPLLNLQMRLGEGTGAALALPLVQAAVNFLNDMASFESAEVSDKLIN
ncbi:MAG: nicotinate-nucleotide--dimethylbenzimidazole phosphoribosyltransferase [Sphingobacteriales bacterium]|nr:MAG: nicotinate-nucleotide--dimethylbenzimidazole phosphoribosyltransferase [Sphingobacteriales bacterium]